MRTHTYKLAKGYAPEYQGREVRWEVPTTAEEAVGPGKMFDTIETLVRRAVAQVNIERGHAIQKATIEKVKDADGKPTDKLANPNMTTAAMEQLAASITAKATDRVRGTGGAAKERAKKFDTAAQKAKEIAASATPETLAALLNLGFITKEEHDARLAALTPAEPATTGRGRGR